MTGLTALLTARHREGVDFEAAWREVIDQCRTSATSVKERLEARHAAQRLWAESRLPVWVPGEADWPRSHLAQLMAARDVASLAELHRWSAEDSGEFWGSVVDRLGIEFRQPPSQILDVTHGLEQPGWLVDAQLNIAESCFRAPPDQHAVIASNRDGSLQTMTYAELRAEANRVASGLKQLGIGPGQRVAILMPMTRESVAIYLGIVLAGCAVVSIADSFAEVEIERRLQIAEADAIFCLAMFARGAKLIDLYGRVRAAYAPRAIVLGDATVTLRPDDVPWDDFLGTDTFAAVAHPAEHPINVLFSSGTTGDPKAIVWDQTTPIKAAADGHFHQDIHERDVVVWPTNLGWMMGPWLIFASLINRATLGLYHDAPAGMGFGGFVQDAKVTQLGVVPTLVRSWRTSQCMEELDWSTIRSFSSTGEASNADDMAYLSALAGFKPIIEYCGGTEIGGGYISSTVVQPNIPATFSTPAMGNRFVILDDEGHAADEGELYLLPPCLGLSRVLLNRDHNQTYYADCPRVEGEPLLRRHGDHFTQLANGYYAAGGRADDTMNLGGIKISSAEIESVLNGLDAVSETAAIAAPPPGGGPDQLIVYVVGGGELGAGRLRREMNRTIKAKLNPLFRVSEVVLIDALPRTASNKVMRRELRQEYDSQRAQHDL
ncbi:MAG: AMP-binding protein [Planctomycetota bacterium]